MEKAKHDPEITTYLNDLMNSLNGLLKHAQDDAYTKMIKRTVVADATNMLNKKDFAI